MFMEIKQITNPNNSIRSMILYLTKEMYKNTYLIGAGTFLLMICFAYQGDAQICDGTVPTYTFDFTGHPDSTFTTPSIGRNGACCGSGNCVHFSMTLDTSAVAVNFQITSGAKPSGSLYYQVDCGPQQAVRNLYLSRGQRPP